MDQTLASRTLTARAVLLGERLDRCGVEQQELPLAGPILLAGIGPGQAFRWGAIALIGTEEDSAAALATRLRPRPRRSARGHRREPRPALGSSRAVRPAHRLAAEWELPERSDALERKLAMIRETSETVLSLIEARRSRALELTVALLIAAELVTALYGLFAG